MAEAIVIRSANLRDITLEEAEEVAEAIRGLNLDCDVRVEGEEKYTDGRIGITWFEILHISAGILLAGEVVKKISDVVENDSGERTRLGRVR